jgi:hypothetical protein
MIGAIILLFVLLVPIAIIGLLVSLIIKNNKNNDSAKSDADFAKMIRAIYIHFVLICLLCAIIGGTIWLFSSTVNLLIPEDHWYPGREHNVAIVGMFTSSALLISTVPLFIYHNKITKK